MKNKNIKNSKKKLLILKFLLMTTTIYTSKYLLNSYLDYRLVSLYSYNHINLKNSTEINIDQIINIILKNQNLTIEEKEITLKLIPIIKENKEYIYNDILIHQLTNLDIKYSANQNDKLIQTNSSISGMYTPPYHTNPIISLYEDKNFPTIDCSSCNNGVLFHELNHTLTNYVATIREEDYSYNKAISLLGELTNEIYTREYGKYFLTNESSGYDDYMGLMYMLCELLEIENLKAYRFDLSANHITKELKKLDQNSKNAEEFMEIINKFDYYKNEIFYSKNEEEFIHAINEIKDHVNKFYNLYKYYYELKYDDKLIENKDVMYSIYSTMFETYEVREVVSKDLYNQYQLNNNILTNKTYFDHYTVDYDDLNKFRIINNGLNNLIKVENKGYFSNEYTIKNPYTLLYINQNIVLCSDSNIKKLNKLF